MIKLRYFLTLPIFLLICLCYWPGLGGDYVFDDVGNILANQALKLDTLNWQSLADILRSGDAGPLGRPISVLSFALNYYFSGSFAPHSFKSVNVVIHATNACLLFLLILTLLPYLNREKQLRTQNPTQSALFAAIAALWWGLHPLNLTSVLYVVQRMTSLATLFGLLGILLYTRARTIQGKRHAWHDWRYYVAASMLLLSVLSKESGALFLPLLLLVEVLLIGQDSTLRNSVFHGRLTFRKTAIFGLVSLALLYCAWAVHLYLNPDVYLSRPFTFGERLLTEVRVLVFYLGQTIAPRLTALSLYHDDFILSESLLSPSTTALCLILLLAISIACIYLRKVFPALLFAWAWFLVSHALESTFVPLELVHEHRNYFAIAMFATPIVALTASNQLSIMTKKWLIAILCFFTALNAFVTWQRATLWSNLVDQAMFEATTHPASDRANYQMGRMYIKLYLSDGDRDLLLKAKDYFNKAIRSYLPENGGYFGLIHVLSELTEEIPESLINELESRLGSRHFHNSNIAFLDTLTSCQLEGKCKMESLDVVRLLAAPMENPRTSGTARIELYKMLARYYSGKYGDYPKAELFLREALSQFRDASLNFMLAQVLTIQGKKDEARSFAKIAAEIDKTGSVRKDAEEFLRKGE